MRSFFKTYGVSPEGLVLCLDQSDGRSSGDLGHWYDLSPYANHGVQATAGKQPAIGGAAGLAGMTRIFDGVDDFISISPLNVGSLYTYSFWINPSSISTRSIFGEGAEAVRYWYLSVEENLVFRHVNGTHYFFTANITTDNWQCINIVYKDDNLSIYRNGVFVSVTNQAGIAQSLSTIGFGRTTYTLGQIPQVHIWNRALNSGEISSLYNATRMRFGK